jgi:hypothetical protein
MKKVIEGYIYDDFNIKGLLCFDEFGYLEIDFIDEIISHKRKGECWKKIRITIEEISEKE